MSRFWSDVVERLSPYVPGEQPQTTGLIKLNTNENPYPPSPKALAVLAGEVGSQLHLYPDPSSSALKDAIAEATGVSASNVFVGNGSDEVLALTFLAFFQGKAPLRVPDVSYGFFPVYCQLFGVAMERIPLAPDFRIDLAPYLAPHPAPRQASVPASYAPADPGSVSPPEPALGRDRGRDAGGTGGGGPILFPNPNAPTGVALRREEIEALLDEVPNRLVVVDEAYVDFGAESVAPLVASRPNLLVVQTLSKSRSLAGLRVGFALGHADLIHGLDRVKNSFNSYPIDRIAESVAIAALGDADYFRACCARIIETRDATAARLVELGFAVLPSRANFLFVQPASGSAQALQRALRERGILVRHFAQPRIDRHLRITIGTPEQMDRLVSVLSELRC